MTREELIKIVCPAFMTSNCGEQVDCNYCKKKMNKWLDEYDKQIRAEIFNEIMPILIGIVDKEGCCYGYEQEIDRFECEWEQLKEQNK